MASFYFSLILVAILGLLYLNLKDRFLSLWRTLKKYSNGILTASIFFTGLTCLLLNLTTGAIISILLLVIMTLRYTIAELAELLPRLFKTAVFYLTAIGLASLHHFAKTYNLRLPEILADHGVLLPVFVSLYAMKLLTMILILALLAGAVCLFFLKGVERRYQIWSGYENFFDAFFSLEVVFSLGVAWCLFLAFRSIFGLILQVFLILIYAGVRILYEMLVNRHKDFPEDLFWKLILPGLLFGVSTGGISFALVFTLQAAFPSLATEMITLKVWIPVLVASVLLVWLRKESLKALLILPTAVLIIFLFSSRISLEATEYSLRVMGIGGKLPVKLCNGEEFRKPVLIYLSRRTFAIVAPEDNPREYRRVPLNMICSPDPENSP